MQESGKRVARREKRSASACFKTIVIDPPWKYEGWKPCSIHKLNDGRIPLRLIDKDVAPLPYKSMTVEQIASLPVPVIMAENCELYLWTTQRYLHSALHIVEEWGCEYKTLLTLCKMPRGTGQGGVYCPTTEFIVHARRGLMPKIKRVDTTWWLARATAAGCHSRKPEFIQDIIECVSEPPRAELFARRKRAGWSVWGDEVACDFEFNINAGGVDARET